MTSKELIKILRRSKKATVLIKRKGQSYQVASVGYQINSDNEKYIVVEIYDPVPTF